MGSFLIATCGFIRAMLERVQRMVKNTDGLIMQCSMWSLRCCFWMLQKFLIFISNNAYIMCAIMGHGFFHSAQEAFNLLTRNLVRVIVLDKVKLYYGSSRSLKELACCLYLVGTINFSHCIQSFEMFILMITGPRLFNAGGKIGSHCRCSHNFIFHILSRFTAAKLPLGGNHFYRYHYMDYFICIFWSILYRCGHAFPLLL